MAQARVRIRPFERPYPDEVEAMLARWMKGIPGEEPLHGPWVVRDAAATST